MRSIRLLVHNIRSTHNVGAMLRTCDAFAIDSVIFSGYSPYPHYSGDIRLPHVYRKLTSAIAKTALGAEATVTSSYTEDPFEVIRAHKAEGYIVVGLELDEQSIPLAAYQPSDKVLLVIGEEVNGISLELRELCDVIVEIPMLGDKESLNVSIATGIALYHLRTSR